MMKIQSGIIDSILVITLSGKFNIEEVSKFEESIAIDITKKLRAIVINFAEIEYIDSSALGSLIKLMNKAKNLNIDFVLYDMTPPILSIFRLAYLDKFFTITVSDALKTKYPELA
ncbi:MAG: STAS domain-containing protein [Spirochaetota bacterium]